MVSHNRLHRRHKRAAMAEAMPLAEAVADVETVVSIVYVTASKTFTGAIGGYITPGLSSTDSLSSTHRHQSTTIAEEGTPTETSESSSTRRGQSSVPSSTTLITAVSVSAVSSIIADTDTASATSLPSSLIVSSSASVSNSIEFATPTMGTSTSGMSMATSSSTASSADSTSTPTSSSSGGMSSAGKAGLAIGILLAIGAVLSLVFFCFRQRKKAAERERLEDEKTSDAAALASKRAASARTTSTAPRLSLRPVTQFLPQLASEKAQNQNAGAQMTNLQPQRSAWERPVTPSDNTLNPFGNHAETIESTNTNGTPTIVTTGPDGGAVSGAAAGGAAGGAAALALARGASKRGNGPKPIDFTTNDRGAPSPTGTEFSATSDTASQSAAQIGSGSSGAAAIAAAGGPVNSTVHRVQLDFKPSMEDELELRAGQLVRLLHEYDDGWALCIRLDRSRQGVVPRTCLSTRPVKPRPQGPNNMPLRGGPMGPPGMRSGQPQRPMSPSISQGPPGGQQGPRYHPQGRPMTPQGRPMTPQGRPMTPQGQPQGGRARSQSTSSQMSGGAPDGGRSRSASVSQAQQMARRNSPPGPSPMNPNPSAAMMAAAATVEPPRSPPAQVARMPGRKPVPGQAM